MSDTIIQIEDIGKIYRYGKIGSGSLRQDLNKWWRKSVLGRDDQFYKYALPGSQSLIEKQDEFWALQHISFDVKEGEVWGIVGENGAGKSTLLKILSKVTKPTTGVIRGRGKISSLLEVGIGFQPELTGRENIFTSGHILGMKNAEIRSKFDEILDFAGVEQFIDTPVKRYSSGMYMRLAFAVAAHLDPDILIVDEVLAVGDAEFQKKCLNKMKEVSSENGRTIIFVSHNLQAVSNLCNCAMWLQKGRIKKIGEASEVVRKYTASFQKDAIGEVWDSPDQAPGSDEIKMKSIEVKPYDTDDSYISVRTPVSIYVEFWSTLENCSINVNVKLFTNAGECVFAIGSPVIRSEKGVLALFYVIPANLLNNTTYILSMSVMKNIDQLVCEFPTCMAFDVEDDRQGVNYFGTWPGVIRPQIQAAIYMKQPAEDTRLQTIPE